MPTPIPESRPLPDGVSGSIPTLSLLRETYFSHIVATVQDFFTSDGDSQRIIRQIHTLASLSDRSSHFTSACEDWAAMIRDAGQRYTEVRNAVVYGAIRTAAHL